MCEMVQNVSPPVHRTDFIGKPGQVQPDKVMNTLTSIHIFFLCVFTFLHSYKWICSQNTSSRECFCGSGGLKHTTVTERKSDVIPMKTILWQELVRWILSQCICIQKHSVCCKQTHKCWSRKWSRRPEAPITAVWSQLRSLGWFYEYKLSQMKYSWQEAAVRPMISPRSFCWNV